MTKPVHARGENVVHVATLEVCACEEANLFAQPPNLQASKPGAQALHVQQQQQEAHVILPNGIAWSSFVRPIKSLK